MRYAWHFIRWNKVKLKLTTFLAGGLWLARLNTFKDIWEGKLPVPNLGLLNMLLPPNAVASVLAEYEKAANTGFASCWHLSDGDPDPQMWEKSNFGDGHNGIAIRTSCATLKSELQHLVAPSSDGPLHISAVTYIDHANKAIPEAQTLEAAFSVREEYSYQRELRIFLTTRWGAAAQVLPGLTNVWGTPLVPIKLLNPGSPAACASVAPCLSVPEPVQRGKAAVPRVNPSVLIEQILVGWRVNSPDRKDLQEMLRKVGIEDRLRFEDAQ